MSTYQQQLAKCMDTTDDYSNIWRSTVWTIADYEELFVDIERGYIIQSTEGNYFIINPDWKDHRLVTKILELYDKYPKNSHEIECRHCGTPGWWNDIADDYDDDEYGCCADCEEED